MQCSISGAVLAALSASAAILPAAAQDPLTRPFSPVQLGPVAQAPEVSLYLPGRVLVQVTEEAHDRSLLPRTWQPQSPQQITPSGLLLLDAELQAVQAQAISKAMIDAARPELERELGLHRWYLVEVPSDVDVQTLARRLQALPDVEDASPDWRAFPADVPNDPLHGNHWGHRNTGQMLSFCWGCGGHPGGSPVGTVGFDSSAETAWDGSQGYGSSSIVIAIIDSGVDVGHPDLNQVAGYDYGDNDSNADDNSAQAGHGTACAGVAAAIHDNGLGTAGIAGGCSIMPLKVANSAGSMSFSSVANAIIHSADNGADIASLSLGAAISNESGTSSAINYAHSNGVVILAATANSNQSTIDFPANHSLVIGVGAASPCGERKRSSSSSSEVNPGVATDPNGYTCDGERWWGSNYGTNSQDAAGAVDVIAPTILPTTDIQGSAGYDSGNYSLWFNGTSCSTPYAAGVCALIKSKNPGWSPTQIRDRLVDTADDVTSVESGSGWDRFTGYGMVNAAAAVDGGGGTGGGPVYASLPYSTGFDSGSLDDSWTTASNNEGRILLTTANGPFSGARHMVMDDSVNGSAFSTNEAWLHLDLAGEGQVDLSFRWKEFGDETHSQDGVYFSNNGGNSFSKVHSFAGSSTTNNSWQLVSLDLDALASSAGLGLNSTFVVKFQQYDNYSATVDGFAFDEIEVEAGGGGGGNGHASLPYSTGFESGALDNFWETASNNQGRILITTGNGPYSGSYHMTMDDSVNGGNFSTNQALLKVNLQGEGQVNLSFRWKEFGDETHSQDGVYFSDDGGSSFTKVRNLNGGSTSNNSWQLINMDVDSLAASNGLSMSANFVIMFQQYDNYDTSFDGFAFDSIVVD